MSCGVFCQTNRNISLIEYLETLLEVSNQDIGRCPNKATQALTVFEDAFNPFIFIPTPTRLVPLGLWTSSSDMFVRHDCFKYPEWGNRDHWHTIHQKLSAAILRFEGRQTRELFTHEN